MIRVVFDTNAFISAMLHPDRTSNAAFETAFRSCRFIMSLSTLDELVDVSARQKFDRYVRPEDRAAFIQRLLDRVDLISPTETIRICRNPRDDKFLEVAVAGNAQYLVTGDDDLLSLFPFRSIQIVTAADFLAALDKSP